MNKLIVARVDELGERNIREVRTHLDTLLCLKRIRNKVLRRAQGTVLNVMCQSGWEGSWIHVYLWLSALAVHLKLSQHC